MIVDTLDNISKYSEIIPKKAIKFMISLDNNIKSGRYNIDEESYANIDEYEPKLIDKCKFEAHKKYIDIQMIVCGEEEIHLTDIKNLKVSEKYDENRDIMFFENSEKYIDKIKLVPNKFVLIYPHEAHKPQIKTTANFVKKIVVKIPN